ncbi:MAG TPA: response regulator transcription factor [Dermatophilaceae bacterium]
MADDQELVRDGLAAILDAEQDMGVVGTAADGAEAVGLIQSVKPDVALIDIRMPEVDGLEATRRLVTSGAATPILILTTFGNDANVLEALRAGASGFLLKDAPRASLLAAVRSVAAGDVILEESVLRQLVKDHLGKPSPPESRPRLDRLTPKESEVLLLVANGQSNQEIAKALFISETTVKTHIAHTLAKLGARDRIQLAVLAHQSGLT